MLSVSLHGLDWRSRHRRLIIITFLILSFFIFPKMIISFCLFSWGLSTWVFIITFDLFWIFTLSLISIPISLISFYLFLWVPIIILFCPWRVSFQP